MYPQISVPDASGMLRLCPDLAAEIGQDESIILLQIDYLCQSARTDKRSHNYQDEHWWTYQTVKDWQEKWFKWMSAKSVERKLKHLETSGYIVTGNYNRLPLDRTIWYRPNYDKIAKLKAVKVVNYDPPIVPDEPKSPIQTSCLNGQNVKMQSDKLSEAIPKTPTKIYKEEEKSPLHKNDESVEAVSFMYENEIGLISPIIKDKIIDMCNEYPLDWIRLAFDRAADQNVRKLSYISGILTNWRAIGGPQNDKPKGHYNGHSNGHSNGKRSINGKAQKVGYNASDTAGQAKLGQSPQSRLARLEAGEVCY